MSGKTEIMNHKSRLCYPVNICFKSDCIHHGKKSCPEICIPRFDYKKKKGTK
jgi:hypothetical protein